MIELIFVACLAASPEDCEEKALVYVDVTPQACMMGAQPQLARWAETHPGWTIGRWKCQYVSTRHADI